MTFDEYADTQTWHTYAERNKAKAAWDARAAELDLNDRLIAAAPELLDALIKITTLLEKLGYSRAAIMGSKATAKAKGG